MRHLKNQDMGEDAAASTPTNCPACRSCDVKTTSKVANSTSYWRCEACGEVWNVGRLRAASRYSSSRPWGR